MDRQANPILEGPLLSSIIKYTIPIILTSVLQSFFNAADLIVVGQFCGSLYVGAVGASGYLTNLIISLFTGLSVGTGVCVANGVGCDNKETVRRTVHTAIPAALLSGVILTVVGVFFSETFLNFMSTPEDILPYSKLYMQIYFGGITFTMIYNFAASMLRAVGDTKGPLIYLTTAGVVNVVLNVIFVTVFGMNVDGVALATIISQGVAAFLVVRALMKRTDACKFEWKKMHFYKDELLKMIRIGLPAGIQGSLFSISNVTVQSSVNSFGPIATTGNSASSNIEHFLYVALNAFQHTTVNFVGQNYGAKNYKRLIKVVWTCCICVIVVGLVAGVTMYAFGHELLSIYINDSPEAVEYGMTRLGLICVPYFLCGLMEITTGALRGIGSSMPPMIISIVGVCGFRLFWVYTIFAMDKFHTPSWLYSSYGISWIITFLSQLLVFLLMYKRLVKMMPDSDRKIEVV